MDITSAGEVPSDIRRLIGRKRSWFVEAQLAMFVRFTRNFHSGTAPWTVLVIRLIIVCSHSYEGSFVRRTNNLRGGLQQFFFIFVIGGSNLAKHLDDAPSSVMMSNPSSNAVLVWSWDPMPCPGV